MSYENPTSAINCHQVQAERSSYRIGLSQPGVSRAELLQAIVSRDGSTEQGEAAPGAQRSEHRSGYAGRVLSPLVGNDLGSAPAISNTGATTSKNEEKPELETGGLDMLEVSLYGAWPIDGFGELRAALESCRTAAEAGDNGKAWFKTPDGDEVQVKPHGGKKGQGGAYCRWILETSGFKFLVRDRAAFDEHNPSVFVVIGSLTLMELGAKEAWSRATAILSALGFEVCREVVGRADPCVDFANVSCSEVVKPIADGAYVCRAIKDRFYRENRKYTGFEVGKEVHLRIYDKLTEVRHDVQKLAVLIRKRWGCLPVSATRLEFQLRREQLRRRWQVGSVADLLAKLPFMIDWLTKEWFRMTTKAISEEQRDNNNQSKFEVSQFWEGVVAAFKLWTGKANDAFVLRKTSRAKPKQLIQQALGCLAAAAALEGVTIKTAQQLWKYMTSKLRTHCSETLENCIEKRRALSCRSPSILLIDPADIPF